MLILEFIRQYWLGIVGAVLAAVFFFEHAEVSHLEKTVTQCESENAVLEDANQKLAAALKNQNAAVANLQTQSQAKSRAAAKSLALAKHDAAKYAAKAERIMSFKDTGNNCADMIRLLNEYAKQEK